MNLTVDWSKIESSSDIVNSTIEFADKFTKGYSLQKGKVFTSLEFIYVEGILFK
jgi:hypothetical protein